LDVTSHRLFLMLDFLELLFSTLPLRASFHEV
jgi:hypothetical protein